ncbi:MAG TPA: EF-hand domain-containing protein [Gammaproteobacteria bacterium]|nr:EF-hand domain-containing protein [Gammaproteobacteria bacterium]
MKNLLAATMISALALAGPVSAGMQGQGAAPDAKKPEYKEPNPGPYGYRLMEMDKDADKSISKQEARVNRHLFEHFNKIDQNGDGKLDKAELSAFQG